MRAGLGYDVHKLVEGRDLILGGVKTTGRTPLANGSRVPI